MNCFETDLNNTHVQLKLEVQSRMPYFRIIATEIKEEVDTDSDADADADAMVPALCLETDAPAPEADAAPKAAAAPEADAAPEAVMIPASVPVTQEWSGHVDPVHYEGLPKGITAWIKTLPYMYYMKEDTCTLISLQFSDPRSAHISFNYDGGYIKRSASTVRELVTLLNIYPVHNEHFDSSEIVATFLEPKCPSFSTAMGGEIKSALDKAISNNMPFAVYNVPFDQPYPHDVVSYEVLHHFLTEVLVYKELPAKALEGMQKAWVKKNGPNVPFVRKPQHAEILVVLVVPGSSHVYVGISKPSNSNFDLNRLPPMFQPMEGSGTGGTGGTDPIGELTRTRTIFSVTPDATSSVFKTRDLVVQEILRVLREARVYVDDTEDETMDYTINDL